MNETLHIGQVVVSVFALVGAMLLGYMLKQGAQRSTDYFSSRFLRWASWAMVFIAVEVVFAEYRMVRIPAELLPTDAVIAGFIGRVVEGAGLWGVIGYLVRGNGKVT